jgi:integrase
MENFSSSAIQPAVAICGATRNEQIAPYLRSGTITIANAVDLYMSSYAGRDKTRSQRMRWWQQKIGNLTLNEIDEDHIFFAIQDLSLKQARYWSGIDADGNAIYKSKGKPLAPSTINRYSATIGALFTWCIRQRLTPKGWCHPCRGIERRPENNEITRFLSEEERKRLLAVCKESKWPKLYILVMMGITTGARKSELLNLKWNDIDLERAEAYVGRTKNGDKKILPLVPIVIKELKRFKGNSNELLFASTRCPSQGYNFTPTWQKALKEARVKNFRFHDLRHSCASYLAQNGATLLEIGDVLGQRQLNVTKRYSHLTTSHKANLINKILGEIQ